ncbi:MAG: sensor histidine kinase [Burkholderiales bacterium]|nr:sensor histidine kinase [Burkholderiales bacterium]
MNVAVGKAVAGAAVPSLRQRLSRFVLVLALTWVALASVLLALWVREEVFELLDDGLVAASEALAVVLLPRAPVPPAGAQGAVAGNAAAGVAGDARDAGVAGKRGDKRKAGETPFAWQLVDEQGTVLQHSPHAPVRPLAQSLSEGLSDGPGGWRVHARALGEGRWLLVGQEASERSEDSLEVAVGTIGVAFVVSLAGLAGLRWRLDRETQPLADLAQVLGRYDPMKPDAQLPPPALRELAPVHEAVQQLGRRLAEHAAAERAFSAHAAHALRTPLAGLDAQLAVAQREAPPGELQARLARMRGATARLSRVVGALLALFRSSSELRRTPVDVEALLARLPLEGLAVELAAPAARPQADSDLLAAALMNLLDNAVRHGAQRVRVQVQGTHVTLADDGPGVSGERLEGLRRALGAEDGGDGLGADAGEADEKVAGEDGAKVAGRAVADQAFNGLGLGLVLADRVARVHGGRLELLAPDAGFAGGRGFVVRLWLAPPQATVERPQATIEPPQAIVEPPRAPGEPPQAPGEPAPAAPGAPTHA